METMQRPGGLFRAGLVGFFATLSVLSLALNAYLVWVINRPSRDEAGGLRTPAPVSASDHVRGPSDAPVTLIVYSDFECPFCRELHTMLKDLVATERFQWVLRHYPLESHPNAARYAEACECAGKQGRFWEFADWLFDALAPAPAQTALTPPGTAAPLTKQAELPTERLVEAAAGMGLDARRFRECLESQQEKARVQAQKTAGDSLGITATPTLFVNGRRMVGAPELHDLRNLVDGDSR